MISTSRLTVGLEQISVSSGAPDENRELMAGRATAAFNAGAQLVVLPELAASGYVVDPVVAREVAEPLEGPTLDRMTGVASAHHGLVTYGFCESAGSRLFNSVVVAGAGGPMLHYRKLHLFGEEKDAYTPGDLGLPVAETALGTLGVCICYDLRFVEAMRVLSLQGADVVLAPAAWVGGFDRTVPTAGAPGQVASLTAQANLDQVAVVAVSQVAVAAVSGPATLGGSVACDSYGELLAGPLSRAEPDSARAVVDLEQVWSSRHRSETIQPRADRRTDVYSLSYAGVMW
jgi:predicted amidohydrolase